MTRQQSLFPDKPYYRIGEMARILGIETHVLRYWESEFPELQPVRAGSGQRLYRREDLELLLRIKSLLHEEGYTIAGAKKLLAREGTEGGGECLPAQAEAGEKPAALEEIRSELKAILKMLG